jgi:hypothetical protein
LGIAVSTNQPRRQRGAFVAVTPDSAFIGRALANRGLRQSRPG